MDEDANAARGAEVHFSAYWVAAMISMTIAVLGTTSAVLAIAYAGEWRVAVMAAIALISSVLMGRAVRVSMTVGSEAVTVHSFLKSHRLPWASIESVVLLTGSWIDDGELVEFRLRGNERALAQASLGRRARRNRIRAAIKPAADALGRLDAARVTWSDWSVDELWEGGAVVLQSHRLGTKCEAKPSRWEPTAHELGG